jgi:Flp pilus assembly protein TadG
MRREGKDRGRRAAQRLRMLRSEKGQMLAFMAVGIFAMIGLGAFVMDVGAGYRQQRHAQAAADGSALAAAQMLPQSPDQARVASDAVAAKNIPDGTLKLSFATTYSGVDTAVVHVDTTSQSFLAKIFKISIFKESADATAVAGSYTGWSKGMAPWVTDQSSLVWGQMITFKVKPGNQASSGNFGGADLPVQEKSCQLASGGNDYRDLIAGATHSCMISVGNWLQPETGNLTGPTGSGLAARGVIQGFNPYSIMKQLPDGEWVLTNYTHPNVVVIPVIDSFHQGSSSPFKVIGFAWFIITSYTNNTVTGMFIDSSAPGGAKCGSSACPFGGYNPYSIKVIQLTK